MIGEYLMIGIGGVLVAALAVAAPLGLVASVQSRDIPFAVFCGVICLVLIATAMKALGI
jgi:hypothetical protein